MNTEFLNKAFNEFSKVEGIKYAVIDTDELGETRSDIDDILICRYGKGSKGVYIKHWTKGMNRGSEIKDLELVYIGHELTEQQGQEFINICSKYFEVEPKMYTKSKCFKLSEKR